MEDAVTALDHLLQSLAMFFSLTSLLRWKHRRENTPHRLRRGLRVFATRVARESV